MGQFWPGGAELKSRIFLASESGWLAPADVIFVNGCAPGGGGGGGHTANPGGGGGGGGSGWQVNFMPLSVGRGTPLTVVIGSPTAGATPGNAGATAGLVQLSPLRNHAAGTFTLIGGSGGQPGAAATGGTGGSIGGFVTGATGGASGAAGTNGALGTFSFGGNSVIGSTGSGGGGQSGNGGVTPRRAYFTKQGLGGAASGTAGGGGGGGSGGYGGAGAGGDGLQAGEDAQAPGFGAGGGGGGATQPGGAGSPGFLEIFWFE